VKLKCLSFLPPSSSGSTTFHVPSSPGSLTGYGKRERVSGGKLGEEGRTGTNRISHPTSIVADRDISEDLELVREVAEDLAVETRRSLRR
jgi:hypothetical protein